MPVVEASIKNLKPFSSDRQPTKRTPRGPSVLTPLKRFLKKNIVYEDPETKKMVMGKVQDVIALRLILNATQGENEAIKEIFNRIEGKLPDTTIDQSIHNHKTFVYLDPKAKEENADSNRIVSELPTK